MSVFKFSLPLATAVLVCSHTTSATEYATSSYATECASCSKQCISKQQSRFKTLITELKKINPKILKYNNSVAKSLKNKRDEYKNITNIRNMMSRHQNKAQKELCECLQTAKNEFSSDINLEGRGTLSNRVLYLQSKSLKKLFSNANGEKRIQRNSMVNDMIREKKYEKKISDDESTKDTANDNTTRYKTNNIKEIKIHLRKNASNNKSKTKSQSIYTKPNKVYIPHVERALPAFQKTLSELEQQHTLDTSVKEDLLDLAKQGVYVSAKDLKSCITYFSKYIQSPSSENIEILKDKVNKAYREYSEYVKNNPMTDSNGRDYLAELREKQKVLNLAISTLFYVKHKNIPLPLTDKGKELWADCDSIRQEVLEEDLDPNTNYTSSYIMHPLLNRQNIYNKLVRRHEEAKSVQRPLEDVAKERIVFKSKPLKKAFLFEGRQPTEQDKLPIKLQYALKYAKEKLSTGNTSWTMNKKINFLLKIKTSNTEFNKKLAQLLEYKGPSFTEIKKMILEKKEKNRQKLKNLADKEGTSEIRRNETELYDAFSTKSTLASATKSKFQFYDSSCNKFKTTGNPYVKKFATNDFEYTLIRMLPAKQ